MDGFYYGAIVIAMVMGLIDGLIKLNNGTPSFWRGFGEGMAGRGKYSSRSTTSTTSSRRRPTSCP